MYPGAVMYAPTCPGPGVMIWLRVLTAFGSVSVMTEYPLYGPSGWTPIVA